jgi:preprotein translocase subunit SecA
MSLYKQWTDMVVEYVKTKGEQAFWDEYMEIEKALYKELLAKHKEKFTFTIDELANNNNTTPEFIMGFIDGINDSLKNTLDLEAVTVTDEISLEVDLENLYFNMLDAKAEYLYTLPQWEGIFSPEKRKEIQKKYRDSAMVRNDNKIGRNDPCTCGSGKKYKKCCGK